MAKTTGPAYMTETFIVWDGSRQIASTGHCIVNVFDEPANGWRVCGKPAETYMVTVHGTRQPVCPAHDFDHRLTPAAV